MILTVTLNAAIDRTVAVPSFRLGNRHRATEARSSAGGKGINVARALKLLGRPVIATGLAGGQNGSRILERLSQEQILHDFTMIGGESRINLAVVDPTTGEQTEINERGPTVSAEEAERFVDRLVYLADGASLCALSGSLPPGLPDDMYARLIEALRSSGVDVLFDTDGELMRQGLSALPDVVCPNVIEAEEAAGFEFADAEDTAAGLRSLLEMGAKEAIITSPSGCAAVVGEGVDRRRYDVSIESLEPVSSTGSGDCFLAGYAAARYEGGSPAECLAMGVACGAESTQHLGAGNLDRRAAERLVGEVEVVEASLALGVG
ncbi:1-phosphofructokinase family hexose kinase [Thermoleophilia bacterium SCSIO 60948]|nr:1-phosphofructokinase family hexose kinase [Thermoleophilia bacterium SCSIO 60948]